MHTIKGAILLACCFSLQVQSMFRFFWSDTSVQKIDQVVVLQKRAQQLSEKNPSNIMLKSYLATLHDATNVDNCDERKSNLQTLLFPCNTHMSERFAMTCQQDMPEEVSSWLKPWLWHKKPVRIYQNIGKETDTIIKDTKDSLQFSDGVALGAGCIIADSLVRRNSDNIWLTLLASPLYVAVPLTALWLKKCRMDVYPISVTNHFGFQSRNQNLQDQNEALDHNLGRVKVERARLQTYVRNGQQAKRKLGAQAKELKQETIELTGTINRVGQDNQKLRHELLQNSLSFEIARRKERQAARAIKQEHDNLRQDFAVTQAQLQESQQARAHQDRLLQDLLDAKKAAQRAHDLTSDSPVKSVSAVYPIDPTVLSARWVPTKEINAKHDTMQNGVSVQAQQSKLTDHLFDKSRVYQSSDQHAAQLIVPPYLCSSPLQPASSVSSTNTGAVSAAVKAAQQVIKRL